MAQQEQKVRKLKQEVRKIWKDVSLHCNTDRNKANSLKGFAREFFNFAKVMRKIAIKLGTQKRNTWRSLPVIVAVFVTTSTLLLFQNVYFGSEIITFTNYFRFGWHMLLRYQHYTYGP